MFVGTASSLLSLTIRQSGGIGVPKIGCRTADQGISEHITRMENQDRLRRHLSIQKFGQPAKCRFARLAVFILSLASVLYHAVIHAYWKNLIMLDGTQYHHFQRIDSTKSQSVNYSDKKFMSSHHSMQTMKNEHHRGSIHHLNSKLASHYYLTRNINEVSSQNFDPSSYLSNESNNNTSTRRDIVTIANDVRQRYLIFQPPLQAAQGIGNMLNGLLAAHYLGEEFDRHVCVSKEWEDFHRAFVAVEHSSCALLLDEASGDTVSTRHSAYSEDTIMIRRRSPRNTIWLLNFSKRPVNECKLRDRLASNSEPILYLVANAYPRWPLQAESVFKKSFDDLYRPRTALLDVLPWKTAAHCDGRFRTESCSNDNVDGTRERSKLAKPPLSVVHLRQSDGSGDARQGLDPETLRSLGELLPSSTYLVTNQVDYYHYFESHFGWNHPNWTVVRHSALPNVVWRAPKDTSLPFRRHHTRLPHPSTKNFTETVNASAFLTQKSQDQPHPSLHMWSDWYTIFRAKRVFHTHSDFSLSAAHWKYKGPNQVGCHNCELHESYAIRGWDPSRQTLILLTPSWGKTALEAKQLPNSTIAWINRSVKNGQRRVSVLSSSSQSPPPALSQRAPQQLLHCDLPASEFDVLGMANAFDLDDEIST